MSALVFYNSKNKAFCTTLLRQSCHHGGVGERGEWGVGSGEWGVGSGEWAVGSGQWGVDSGEWGVGSGEWGNVGTGSGDRGAGNGELEEYNEWSGGGMEG